MSMAPKGSKHEASVWQADLISIAALVLFVILVVGFDRLISPTFNPTSLLLTGILLAVVPAFIWIAFFYRRDRLEPEPKALVLQVFLLGGLIAAAVGLPMIDSVFDTSSWINRSLSTQILGAILVVGFTHEFLKYAAVRFSVYGAAEFDEPIDGIIYATAAGLGYAAVLNIAFVVSSGGVDLGTGIIRITVTSLAHASFAGVTGYFLGQEKFKNKPAWWTAAGVGMAAVLNGVFFTLRNTLTQGSISSTGGSASRWLGFILAALLASVITALLSASIRKQTSAETANEEA
jgi:RsiW-degrading membrane proteinase PrsW (M82 family)